MMSPADVLPPDPCPEESSPIPDPVAPPRNSVAPGADDFILGTPAAGRAITGALVAGIAATVGIVMVSVVAMLITALAGTLIAYAVAHDDEWVRAFRRRRARRRHVLVVPGYTRHLWAGHHGVGRHAAT
ncbi:hypothetical protein C8K36_101839 [Rhodococcus sp. OK519]|nr:hypothetical protein C8K36_101839 [Rhodococcus sp. OK519]